MNLNHLKFAREVARTHSFTEASKVCCVTQPTLSNGIGQLEEALGAKLFERTTRKVSLTPFGQHMLPVMLQMLDARSEIEQSAEQFLNPVGEQLTVGFSPLADMRIIKTVVDLYADSKAVKDAVLFQECFMEDLYARVDKGEIELAICPCIDDRVDDSQFSAIGFYQEPVFVLQKSDGKGASEGVPNRRYVDDLESEVFALTPDLCGHAPATRSWFKQRGRVLNEYQGDAVSYQAMQEWAELGIASAILPWSKISDTNRKIVSQLYLDRETPAMLEFKVVWKTDSRYGAQIADFIDHCKMRMPPVVTCLELADEKFQVAS